MTETVTIPTFATVLSWVYMWFLVINIGTDCEYRTMMSTPRGDPVATLPVGNIPPPIFMIASTCNLQADKSEYPSPFSKASHLHLFHGTGSTCMSASKVWKCHVKLYLYLNSCILASRVILWTVQCRTSYKPFHWSWGTVISRPSWSVAFHHTSSFPEKDKYKRMATCPSFSLPTFSCPRLR